LRESRAASALAAVGSGWLGSSCVTRALNRLRCSGEVRGSSYFRRLSDLSSRTARESGAPLAMLCAGMNLMVGNNIEAGLSSHTQRRRWLSACARRSRCRSWSRTSVGRSECCNAAETGILRLRALKAADRNLAGDISFALDSHSKTESSPRSYYTR